MSTRIMLALVSALGVGCAGYQVVPTAAPADALFSAPPAGQSKVCIVRPQSKVLAPTAVVHDNGHLVGGTSGESYFCYLAQPGTHHIVADSERQTADVDANAKAGSTYYLKQDVQTGAETTITWSPMSTLDVRQSARGLHYVTLAAGHGEAVADNGAILPAGDGSTRLATRPSDSTGSVQ